MVPESRLLHAWLFGVEHDRSHTDAMPMHEALRTALLGNVPALSRMGVSIQRPPWWRRKLQAKVAPRRYRRWWQAQVLDQLDQAAG